MNIALITAFNNTLDDFLVDIQNAFPNETYLKAFYNGFLLLKKTNPKQTMTTFMEYVGPHAKEIKECNLEYFLNFSENENHLSIDDMYVQKGMRLKFLWTHPDTTDHTRACIISYMQNLLKLGEKMQSL